MIGKRLKEQRKKHKMTQVALAKKMGVTKGTISTWEIDSRIPPLKDICTLCDLFGVTLDYLVGRDYRENIKSMPTKQIDDFSEINNQKFKIEKINIEITMKNE